MKKNYSFTKIYYTIGIDGLEVFKVENEANWHKSKPRISVYVGNIRYSYFVDVILKNGIIVSNFKI